MKKQTLRRPDLAHKRSNKIIELGLRNGILTNNAIHKLELPEVSEATAQKLIRRLITRGLLKRWPLRGSKSYLRLGAAAISRWGYSTSYSRRLGPQVLSYLMGCLSLTTYSDPPLQRLLPEELEQFFPGFPQTQDVRQWAYYRVPQDGYDKLVTVRVDFRVGGEKVIQKLSEQVHRYREHPCLAELLDSKRFAIHSVSATPQQEISIRSAAAAEGFSVELITCHDPQLTLFL